MLSDPAPLPANLTAECPPVADLGDDPDVYDLGAYTVDVLDQYQDCSARHHALVLAVKK